VRNRRRKTLGPEQDGRNGHRRSNEHGGMEFLEDCGYRRQVLDFDYGRSISRERVRTYPCRVRVLLEYERGRSLRYRQRRLFSCSRDIVVLQKHGAHDMNIEYVRNSNIGTDKGVVRRFDHDSVNNNNMAQV